MDKKINGCLVKLISYYEIFCDAKYGKWMVWSKPQFSLEILTMAIFLELPESSELLRKEDLKDYLMKNYLEYSDLSKKNVFVEEYFRSSDCDSRSYVYIWSLFHYTYEMENASEDERREFLCISIIFPYIYKLNKFKKIQKADLDILKDKFQIFDYFRELNKKDFFKGEKLVLVKEDMFGEYFSDVIKKVKGLNNLLPKRDEIDTMIEEASYGAKLIKVVYIYKRKF